MMRNSRNGPLIFPLLIFLAVTFVYFRSSNRSVTVTPSSKLYDGPPEKWAHAHCSATMKALYDQKPGKQWPPPCPMSEVSADLRERFQSHGLPMSTRMCLAQRYEGVHVMNWSSTYIDEYCSVVATSDPGTYSRGVVLWLMNGLKNVNLNPSKDVLGVRGAVSLVMGTENPWVECLLLNEGVQRVWTFEYTTINVDHPRMRATQCQLIARDYLAGQFEPIDIIVSYSSLEHSGLGRYGDGLNPEGDKEAVAQAWCMLRPGGLLVLGVPNSCATMGHLDFNAHRVYGFERLAFVSENFELVGFVGDECFSSEQSNHDPLLVLRKPLDLTMKAKKLVAADFARAVKYSFPSMGNFIDLIS
jgi:hypothetical protein